MEVDGRELPRCRTTVLQDQESDEAAVPMVSLDEEDEIVEVEEEAVEEVMRWLEREMSGATVGQAAFAQAVCGSEETCGATFSDSSSTVMASVDTRGVVAGVSRFWPAHWAVERDDGGGRWVAMMDSVSAGLMEDAKEVEEDEMEWLARVLGGAEVELGLGLGLEQDESGNLVFLPREE
ncbi:hypothetical protein GW17_00055407 [Ensete ventricosum]|nr:hypothetical protein GW17_00055407 [Ensete ventricosum]